MTMMDTEGRRPSGIAEAWETKITPSQPLPDRIPRIGDQETFIHVSHHLLKSFHRNSKTYLIGRQALAGRRIKHPYHRPLPLGHTLEVWIVNDRTASRAKGCIGSVRFRLIKIRKGEES